MTEVIIVEDSVGYYQQRTYEFEVPETAPGATVQLSEALDFARLVWNVRLITEPEQRGDYIDIILNPNTIIGTLDANSNINDTVITVDANAAAYVWPGEYLQFNDASMEIVQVKSYVGMQVTLCAPLTDAHAIGTPLGLHVRLADHVYLDGRTDIMLGGKGVRGHFLDTNSNVLMNYTNATGRPKRLRFNVEHYTGG